MDSTPWLNPVEDRAWRAWLAMSDRLRSQIARDLLVDSSLSDADYMVLVHLSEAEDRRVRMTDLADRINWSKSRLSHQLARMQARGLVEREECPSDARGAFAVLGAGGLAEIERAAPKHLASVRRHLIDLLDTEQLTQLATIAERVVDHLRNQSGCAGLPEDPSSTTASEVPNGASEACTLTGSPAGLDRPGWPAATDGR
jgi:DNA-binding MarR family transcriptional regulator